MKKVYTGYRCTERGCKREIILLTDELEQALSEKRFIVCSYCSSKRLLRESEADDLRELMGITKETYKKVNGRVRRK